MGAVQMRAIYRIFLVSSITLDREISPYSQKFHCNYKRRCYVIVVICLCIYDISSQREAISYTLANNEALPDMCDDKSLTDWNFKWRNFRAHDFDIYLQFNRILRLPKVHSFMQCAHHSIPRDILKVVEDFFFYGKD